MTAAVSSFSEYRRHWLRRVCRVKNLGRELAAVADIELDQMQLILHVGLELLGFGGDLRRLSVLGLALASVWSALIWPFSAVLWLAASVWLAEVVLKLLLNRVCAAATAALPRPDRRASTNCRTRLN